MGGFGLSGIPRRLVSNDMGVDGKGLGLLLENEQVTMVQTAQITRVDPRHP